jgi:hypothetical protein
MLAGKMPSFMTRKAVFSRFVSARDFQVALARAITTVSTTFVSRLGMGLCAGHIARMKVVALVDSNACRCP